MKKNKKKIGKWKMMIFAFFIALCIGFGIFYINMGPILFMNPTKTGKIENTGLFAIKDFITTAYLIQSDEEYILFDAGMNVKSFEKVLKENNIDANKVKHVFLTHSDSDHVAALNLFSNAQIYMGEDEFQMVDGQTKRNNNDYNALPKEININQIHLLTEDEILQIAGHQIKGMKAPGHTKGLMLYLLDDQYLFAGDAFKVINHTVAVHPFTMDEETAKITIRELEGILKDIKLVFTSHYGYYEPNQLKFIE